MPQPERDGAQLVSLDHLIGAMLQSSTSPAHDTMVKHGVRVGTRGPKAE